MKTMLCWQLTALSKYIIFNKYTIHFMNDRFLKKTVANKLLNGTTGAVGDIHCHHAKQFTVFSSCSIICNAIQFRITNE